MKTLKPIKSRAMLAVLVIVFFAAGCKSKKAVEEAKPIVLTVNVKEAGAVGNGTTDDTWAFNAAIDQVAASGGGTVYVPQGTYLINPDISIIMKSNVILNMVDSTRIIKVKPSSEIRYNVIRMHKISNAQIKGGKISGERYEHIGTTGEWGMGVSIYEGTNCKLINTIITDCWGDGIVVGSQSNRYGAPNASVNCVISGVESRNNRRQGLTIGGVDSLIVINSKFTHTNGTAPQDGIDIEPDHNTAQKVHIRNCEIAYNARQGVELLAKPTGTAVVKNIYVQNNYIHHNVHSGYIRYASNVLFTNNRMTNNKYLNNRVNYNSTAINSVFDPNTYE
ncbi:MAG TPA: right-handed parallel beta-helix repeat-containing protein [Sphingobacteriaceae bacterium]